MKVLVWMFMGFDRHTTSEHLFIPIIDGLCKEGHSVHLIQKDTGGLLPAIPSELSKYNIVTDIIEQEGVEKSNLIKRYISELNYIKKSKKYFFEDYDAVFIQSNNVAGFAVKAIRKKCMKANITFNVQDIFPYNAVFSNKIKKKSIEFKVLSAVQRYAYKNVNNIITISDDMKELLVQDGVNKEKINVIYNWSYQNQVYNYKNMNFDSVAGIFNTHYFNVVYAGNIGVMQNVDILIEVARILKKERDIWFHIIGNGVYAEKLKKRADEYGVSNITFSPMQASETAPYIYSIADVNVIPLVENVYKTALPSKTATCLACQKPIIFAIGLDSIFGNKAKIETGCAVIESNDANGLAEKILEIKNGKSRCHTKEFFEKNFSKKNVMEYVKIITYPD